jgi:hypothetical protein
MCQFCRHNLHLLQHVAEHILEQTGLRLLRPPAMLAIVAAMVAGAMLGPMCN